MAVKGLMIHSTVFIILYYTKALVIGAQIAKFAKAESSDKAHSAKNKIRRED